MAEKETKNAAAARCLRILAVLPGYALTGISNKALAVHLKTSPVNVSRALETLKQEEFAEKLENGLWGPTIKLLALCMAYSLHHEQQKVRREEVQQRTINRAHTYLQQGEYL